MASPTELNADLIARLPDSGPVVMVNLVRLKARSDEGGGSGWDAYTRYSGVFMPMLKACGGTILWAGTGDGVALGDAASDRWDYVVLVQYPSRRDFLEIVTSPAYAEANVHRENGVSAHVIVAASETYSKLASRS
jgi:uncharacterized protein (DUF1330 family)